MTSYKDIVRAKQAYIDSTDATVLERHAALMKKLLAEGWADEENENYAAAFMYKNACKALVLRYFDEGYCEEDHEALERYVLAALPDMTKRGLTATARTLKACLDFVSSVNDIMKDADAVARRVRDAGWNPVARSSEECREVAGIMNAKIAAVEKLSDGRNIFGKGAAGRDFLADVVSDLRQVAEFALARAEEFDDKEIGGFLSAKLTYLDEERKAGVEAWQSSSALSGRGASVHILCTPFPDEAKLFAVARTEDGSVRLAVVEAADLVTLGKTERTRLTDALARRRTDLIVVGFDAFAGDPAASAVARSLLALGKAGRQVYVTDGSGGRPVYDFVLDEARKDGAVTAVDFAYLAMPPFAGMIKRLKEAELIKEDGSDDEFVRRNLVFAGYVGLNDALRSGGGDWRTRAKERSAAGSGAASEYLATLPDQELFIDDGWGDFSSSIAEVQSGRLHFDYDDIPMYNAANIRKITSSSALGVVAKCGLISEYCLLRNADKSTWEKLGREEMASRIEEATRLVLRTLGIVKDPVVEVLDKLEKKGAGGICYNGGEKIVYLYRSARDYDWIRGAVCHECFHALQHKAMYGGWFDWLQKEFGVTRGRIKQWRVNSNGDDDYGIRGRYFDIDDQPEAYLVQVFESDARAFEFDCAEAAAAVRHLVDLE